MIIRPIKLGISQKSYSNIENNTKKPSEKELDIIASELGVTKEAIKSTTPIIIINDAHNHNVNGNVEHQQNNIDKELLQSILFQLAKKEEQIEKQQLQIGQLFELLSLGKK